MKHYVVDTVALKAHLENLLPRRAKEVFLKAEEGNARLFVPHIVLGELLYIILRGRMASGDVNAFALETLSSLASSPFFEFVEMDFVAWHHFLELSISELHDRMICSIALAKNAEAVVTNDAEMAKVVQTIW